MIVSLKSSAKRTTSRPSSLGFSLVELLAVMAIAFAILIVVYSMLAGVIRSIAESGEQSVRFENVQQVAVQLRNLAHVAESAEVPPDGQSVVFRSGSKPVAITTLKLVEKPFHLESNKAGNGTKSIQGLTGLARGRFVVLRQEGGRKPLIALELWPLKRLGKTTIKSEDVKPIRIEAVVGLFGPQVVAEEKAKP